MTRKSGQRAEEEKKTRDSYIKKIMLSKKNRDSLKSACLQLLPCVANEREDV